MKSPPNGIVKIEWTVHKVSCTPNYVMSIGANAVRRNGNGLRGILHTMRIAGAFYKWSNDFYRATSVWPEWPLISKWVQAFFVFHFFLGLLMSWYQSRCAFLYINFTILKGSKRLNWNRIIFCFWIGLGFVLSSRRSIDRIARLLDAELLFQWFWHFSWRWSGHSQCHFNGIIDEPLGCCKCTNHHDTWYETCPETYERIKCIHKMWVNCLWTLFEKFEKFYQRNRVSLRHRWPMLPSLDSILRQRYRPDAIRWHRTRQQCNLNRIWGMRNRVKFRQTSCVWSAA